MTVGDALLAANIKARQLYGMPGLGLSIKLNDQDILIPGEHGTQATIHLNGQVTSTKEFIKNGDAIELLPGKDGKHAVATVRDLLDDVPTIHVTIDGLAVKLEPSITVNGIPQSLDTQLSDRDKIHVSQARTLAAALAATNRQEQLATNVFSVVVNQKPMALKARPMTFLVGGIPVNTSYILKDQDAIAIQKPPSPTINEVAAELGKKSVDQMTVTFNGTTITIQKQRLSFMLNGQLSDGDTIVQADSQLTITSLNTTPITFSDVFVHTDYQIPESSSSTYQLLRNGSSIGFNDPIFGGDSLEIKFH